ncbi:MAG: carbohydrate ABC transporter substrate-binding protein [Lachnospiraceae bacterium]|nr:carbohydrate ABC transporter substrate-binding protein [Lachnospiraceae bacterium]
MKLRKVLALGLAASLTFSMTGCGSKEEDSKESGSNTENNTGSSATTGGETSGTSGNDADAAKGDLTYASVVLGESYTDLKTSIKWIHHKTDREEDGTIKAYIAEFNKLYPNITVTTEGITDYQEDSLLRLSNGDWGDIMFIPSVEKAELSSYFIPFGTTAEMDTLINFADNWEYNDNCYGIGYMGNAQGLLYNAAVFEKAGVTKLPTTPDELIAALKLIDENTDAIPLYTNYAAGWTMGGQWDAYLGAITTGSTTWLNQEFVHTAEPFANNGNGTGAYALYKILYDAVAQGLTEEDYTTTDWEGCKAMINNGEIGCMVLGSWAVAQMKAAGSNPDDVCYMPFPITVDGVQYATAGPDYCYGINVNSSAEKQAAAMVFVKWMVEKSGWCDFEGGYPISKTAPTSFAFEGVKIVSNEAALAGEEDYMNMMNSESELSFNAGGDAKVQRIVEAAATGEKTFDEIMEEWTKAWNDAQKECEIEVLH